MSFGQLRINKGLHMSFDGNTGRYEKQEKTF